MAEDRLQKSVQGIKDPTARKAEYYKRQREDAEEGGNQAMSDKINKKLGKKSSSVDTESVNKGILGTVPFLAAPEAKLAGMAGKAIGGAAKRFAPAAARAAEGLGSSVVRGAESLAGKAKGAASSAVSTVEKAASKGSKTARIGGKAEKAAGKSFKPIAEAKDGRKAKDVAKDFGKQVKDSRPAAPSRPREARGEFGAARQVPKRASKDSMVGRKKAS